MRRMHARCAAALIMLLSAGAAHAQPQAMMDLNLVDGINRFGFNLFRALAAGDSTNACISPLSVTEVLAMALNGARGETRNEIADAFGWQGTGDATTNRDLGALVHALAARDSAVRMEIANSLWYRNTICMVKQEFIETNRRSYDADVLPLTTSAAVNDWVAHKTHNRITSILSGDIPESAVLCLVNAIYFKGPWTVRFDSTATRKEDFLSERGVRTPCRMMHQITTLSYVDQPRFQMVDVPYAGGAFSMTILLPKQGTTVDTLVWMLTHDRWSAWMRAMSPALVNLAMPRFTAEYGAALIPPLARLGMRRPFGAADFRKICEADLAISEVRHKTFVEVKEEGTEAAAVTAAMVVTTTSVHSGSSPRPIIVRLDHPFIYVIRDRQSGAILFLGKLMQPTKAG